MTIDGTVNLGTFGWCLNGLGTKPVCQGPQLGYELDSDQVFGNNTSFSLPNSLIKWLTYALIVHPIAAGLAAASFLSGCISHCREFSTSRITTWLTSFATTIAFIAFVFDIVLFSIARSRINSASNNDVGLKASLGNAIWLTLAGFILLFLAGCLFGFGHRCIKRRPTQAEKDSVRPQMDTIYASAARKEAEDLEKAEKSRRGGSSGLPAFPEEEVPLTAMPKTEELYAEEFNNSQDIAGVGTGYGARTNGNQSAYNSPARGRTPLPPGAAQPSDTQYGHAEAFTSMYDSPSRQNSPAYGRPSRGRQGSDPAQGAYASPYEAHRQGSSSTNGYGNTAYPDAGLVPAMPDPTQHGGYNPAEPPSRYGQYEPQYNQQQSDPQYDQSQYQQAYGQYPPTAPYTQTTLPPASNQEGFHALAANSRHRQSRSMGAAVNDQSTYGGHHQTLSDPAWPHQPQRTEDSLAYLQPQAAEQRNNLTSGYGEYRTSSRRPADTSAGQVVLSPTTDVYNSYYTPSPLAPGPPAGIPYVADPEATPSPSYHSAEPYQTYGGNAYR